MDVVQAAGSDFAIVLFSAAGLVATMVAILVDTRTQAAELAHEPIRVAREPLRIK